MEKKLMYVYYAELIDTEENRLAVLSERIKIPNKLREIVDISLPELLSMSDDSLRNRIKDCVSREILSMLSKCKFQVNGCEIADILNTDYIEDLYRHLRAIGQQELFTLFFIIRDSGVPMLRGAFYDFCEQIENYTDAMIDTGKLERASKIVFPVDFVEYDENVCNFADHKVAYEVSTIFGTDDSACEKYKWTITLFPKGGRVTELKTEVIQNPEDSAKWTFYEAYRNLCSAASLKPATME